MDPTQDDATPGADGAKIPIDAPLEDFLDDKATALHEDGSRSGAYAAQLERVLPLWIDWLDERGVDHLAALDERTLARWVRRYLDQRVKANEADGDDGITRATAWTYFNAVRAYLGWCETWGYVDQNPAEDPMPLEAMPDRPSNSSGDRQFWSPEQRRTLLRYVDDRAREAIDEDGTDALAPVRDWALAYLIGYSGVRGAEVLSRSDDDREGRNGATWDDLDLDAGTIDVLGKSQHDEQAPLTDKPVPALRHWHDALDPADDWPLFPTFHRPSLWGSVREDLRERGRAEDEVDEMLAPFDDPLDAIREYDCTPPALTTSGGRRLFRRLSVAADVDTSDDPKDYLTLHGGRRGAGEMYYREAGHSAAQRALRHADPSTTSEMYSHIEASELSDIGSEVFDGE
ncbi:tyrosine-type recombinase/integrase [Halostella sp. JP-L12]|uniref:tyrosine-type recombinase/integrase n=1 Tax=Halostella TaxID=1843185 RepID=UPI000EF7AC9A|nr:MULTISPECIES: tyrosine-type recombinase/integrase [Halostella]NHN49894.1 tyrosine-type recombinase/integrase [Halostella sp. JP-L12]